MWPLYPKEWIGTFCFSAFMLVANVAGIGGGGVAIPMAMYFFNLEFKQAVGISCFSIMCATIARFFFNFKEKHPEKPTCCVIDHSMASIMMPLTLLGSLIGTFIFKSFPDLVLIIVLTLMLIVLTWDSSNKYKKLRAKEVDEENKAKVGPGESDKKESNVVELVEPEKDIIGDDEANNFEDAHENHNTVGVAVPPTNKAWPNDV